MTQEVEGWPYMGVAHVGLVHCDPYGCKVKGFLAISSIERNVSKRRHLNNFFVTIVVFVVYAMFVDVVQA